MPLDGQEQLPMSQSGATETPGTVVRAYFAALEAERFEEAVGYLEPASVTEFRQYQIEVARAAAEKSAAASEPDEPDSATPFSPNQPPIPREASFMLSSPLVRQFAGIETLDQLQQLGPSEMLLRFLQARTPEYQQQQTIREGRNPLPDDSLPPEERQVLGAVMEGDALAHVVVRSSAKYLSGRDSESLFVITLRRTDAGWRVVFYYTLPGLENTCYGYSNEPEEGDSFNAF